MVGAPAKTRVELTLAGAVALLGCALVFYRTHVGLTTAPGWEYAVEITTAALTLWRTRYPCPVAVVVIGASVFTSAVAIITAMHGVGRYEPRRTYRWSVLALACATIPVAWWVHSPTATPSFLGLWTASIVVPWMLGHSRTLASAREAADTQARIAAAREDVRARLAREMHDVVAHRISLVVMGSQILRTMVRDEPALDIVNQVSLNGRAAMDEMRAALALVAREDLDTALERLDFARLRSMADQARAAGQPVTLDVLAPSRSPEPDVAERTSVQVVREALTNAVKHAPHAPTRVAVTRDGPNLVVEVSNDPGPRRPRAGDHDGYGLIAMRERVQLVGGALEAGPRPDGGYVVRARIPRQEEP